MTLLGADRPLENPAQSSQDADGMAKVYPIRSQSQTLRDEEPDRDWLTSVELCVEVGITYRQIDHWTRTGLLVPVDGNTPGQGHWHRYPPGQVARAKAVSALLKAGLYLPQIRKHIDQITSTGRLGIGPVTITYIPEQS